MEKGLLLYKSYGKSGRVFSFRLQYETSKSDLPPAFRCATKAVDASGSTGQCYHIIAGYAPTTAHTKTECEEYYDELDEQIAKKRPNDILITATDCNANVGNKQSQYVYLPQKQLVFPKRTSGGKPVQGHGPVAVN